MFERIDYRPRELHVNRKRVTETEKINHDEMRIKIKAWLIEHIQTNLAEAAEYYVIIDQYKSLSLRSV